MSPPSSFPPDLEAKLNEFLSDATPLKATLARITDWQTRHDAEHKKLDDEAKRVIESNSFRLSTLEAEAGRGWAGIARMLVIVVLAAGGGYAVRAATLSTAAAASVTR